MAGKGKSTFRVEFVLIFITTFFWAVGHPVGRFLLDRLHPFQLGASNLVIGFAGVFAFVLISGRRKAYAVMSKKDVLLSLLLGVFGFFFYNICTFSALARIPASMNAVLVSTNVLFITIIAAFFLKEKLTGLKLFYILLATAGAVFVIFNNGFSFRGEGDFMGSIFSILAALTFSVYTILGKKVLERNDPLLVTSLSLLSGALLLSLLTGLTTGFGTFLTLPLSAWMLIVLLGLGMIGIAYPIWFFCLKRVKASHISVFIYMVPVFAGILSYFILGETFSWRFYTGTALILMGIILIGRMDRKPA